MVSNPVPCHISMNRLLSLLKNDTREYNDLYPTLLGHLASGFVRPLQID